MALSKTSLSFVATFLESSAEDLGTAVKPHTFRFPGSLNPSGDYDTGTTDNKFDIIWSDSRALAATTEDLDVRGVLTAALGGAALAMVEVCGIFVRNTATVSTSVLIMGNGTNGAFSGLFNAVGDRIKIGASGLFVWFAPLDGGGLATTAGTADILKFDSGAATITYEVALIGRSA